MMSEAMFGVRRAWRNPALSLLQFVPVGVDQGLEVGPEVRDAASELAGRPARCPDAMQA